MNYSNYLSLTLRIIAIFSALVACGLYFLTKNNLQKKDETLKQLRIELNALKDENESANLEIASLEEDIVAEKQLTEATEVKLDEANAQLAAERQEGRLLQNKLNANIAKTNQLEETANRLRRELVNTENSSVSSSQESVIAQLSERVEELTQVNIQLEDRVKELTNNGSFASEEQGPAAKPGTLTANDMRAIEEEAKIASISSTNGIIVLDTTQDLKLKSGMQLSLIKNAKIAATVKVINLNGNLAIANILPGAALKSLAKGDIVKVLR